MCITFGTEEFTSPLKEYAGVTARCHNCGNYAAHCITRWPWFTVCFVPVLPLAIHKYKEVTCPICRFEQDISTRPDVQAQAQAQGREGAVTGAGMPMDTMSGAGTGTASGVDAYQSSAGGMPQYR